MSSLPQAPKRGKDPRRPQHFGYLPIAKGEKVTGYLAGPVQWFDMHTSDLGSKPCLELMTDGALSCPYCADDVPVVKGACPFYHSTAHKPHMVWLDEGDRDKVEKFRFLLRVQFWREKYKGAPLSVEPCLSQEPEFFSTLPEKNRAADVGESLLRMWKMPHLTAWFRGGSPDSDNAVSTGRAPAADRKPAKPRPGRVDPMYAAAHRKVDAAMNGTGATDDALDRLLKRGAAAPPSQNGKHPPPGGESGIDARPRE